MQAPWRVCERYRHAALRDTTGGYPIVVAASNINNWPCPSPSFRPSLGSSDIFMDRRRTPPRSPSLSLLNMLTRVPGPAHCLSRARGRPRPDPFGIAILRRPPLAVNFRTVVVRCCVVCQCHGIVLRSLANKCRYSTINRLIEHSIRARGVWALSMRCERDQVKVELDSPLKIALE